MLQTQLNADDDNWNNDDIVLSDGKFAQMDFCSNTETHLFCL